MHSPPYASMTRRENRASRTKAAAGPAGPLRGRRDLRVRRGDEAGSLDRRLHRLSFGRSLVAVRREAHGQERRCEAADHLASSVEAF